MIVKLFLVTGVILVVSGPVLAQSHLEQNHTENNQLEQAVDCSGGLPFLGIGLGYNQYTLEQVKNLGGADACQQPLVYNWTLGDSPQTPGNSPHIDFPTQYVPMMWGCGAVGPERVRRFLAEQNYGGPLLVFNEPDRADQANCSADKAAVRLHELQQVRIEHELLTGKRLQLYVGGLARSDSGIMWINAFRASYLEAYGADPFGQDGTLNPVAQGVHFHLYPRYAYPDGAGSVADVSDQVAEWDTWLTQNDLRAWVTEVGVLHAPYQPLPKAEYVYLLERVLPLLFWNERIDHAFIFTLNSISGTSSEEFSKSALIEDSNETAAYQFVQEICSQPGSGYCTPDAKRTIVAAQIVEAKPGEVVAQIDAIEGPVQVSVIPAATQLSWQTKKSTFTRPTAESYSVGYALKTEN